MLRNKPLIAQFRVEIRERTIKSLVYLHCPEPHRSVGRICSGRGSRRRSSRCRLGVTAAAALRRGGRCRSSRSRAAAAAALHREEAGEASDEVVDRTDRHRSSEVQIETRALRRPLMRVVQTRKVFDRHRRV